MEEQNKINIKNLNINKVKASKSPNNKVNKIEPKKIESERKTKVVQINLTEHKRINHKPSIKDEKGKKFNNTVSNILNVNKEEKINKLYERIDELEKKLNNCIIVNQEANANFLKRLNELEKKQNNCVNKNECASELINIKQSINIQQEQNKLNNTNLENKLKEVCENLKKENEEQKNYIKELKEKLFYNYKKIGDLQNKLNEANKDRAAIGKSLISVDENINDPTDIFTSRQKDIIINLFT